MEWLAIGPGPMGTLSEMVLKASPFNRVHAVEAIGQHVPPLMERMEQLGYASRFRAECKMVGKEPLTNPRAEGIIADLLGDFASRWGYVYILRQLPKLNPELKDSIRVFSPEFFGTAFVPVDLSRASRQCDVRFIGPNLALFKRFPFKETQISDRHGILEMYDAQKEFTCSSEEEEEWRTFNEYEWDVEDDFSCDGLACYVIFGGKNDSPFQPAEGAWTCQHANDDLPRACTSWHNVFLPASLPCAEGDVIRVQAHTKVNSGIEPSYRIEVSLRRGGEVKGYHNIEMGVNDFNCTPLEPGVTEVVF